MEGHPGKKVALLRDAFAVLITYHGKSSSSSSSLYSTVQSARVRSLCYLQTSDVLWPLLSHANATASIG
jgi:hypothetical protein